jgi:Fe2+ transport system protein FeoA
MEMSAVNAPRTGYLNDLQPHQCGVVVEVEAPDDELERLMAMGVCGGRTVELVQLGDPLILKVYGTRVGVSARLAAKVRVDVCNPGHCAIEPDETN